MRRTIPAFTLALFFFITHSAFAATMIPGGSLPGDTIWTPAESPYVIESTVQIPAGVTLTMLPGTIVKVPLRTLPFYVFGTLTIGASSGDPVIVTSLNDDSVGGDTNNDGTDTTGAAGDWRSISVQPGGTLSATHATFRYGGYSEILYNGGWSSPPLIKNEGGNVAIDHSTFAGENYEGIEQTAGMTTITNSLFDGTGRYGIFSTGGSVAVSSSTFSMVEEGIYVNRGGLEIVASTFTGVTKYDVYMDSLSTLDNHGGNIGTRGMFLGINTFHDLTLPKDGLPYIPNMYVGGGTSLTILPGALLKVPLGGRPFTVDGTLVMGSSTGERVTLTSITDDTMGGDTNSDGNATTPSAGAWIGMQVNPGGKGIFTNTTINYGGGFTNVYGNPALKNAGGEVTFDGVALLNSLSYGISQTSGTTAITNSEIANTTMFGISMGGGNMSIHHSSIHDNHTYAIYNTTGNIIDATENWWGAAGGPTHPSNPFGAGDKVTDNVNFGQWLTAEPTGTCTTNCNSSVLFLPGIEASRLFETNVLGDENQLWEPNRNADVEKLYLNDLGVTIRHGIYAKKYDVLNETALPFVGPNIYKSFISAMNKLKADNLIDNWEPIAYDWRLSLQDILKGGRQDESGRIYYSGMNAATTSPYVIQELRHLAATSRTKKVTIIAHSNGGLVAKALLEKLKEDNDPLYAMIDKIIFVAVPQVGTPAALAAVLHGYDQDHLFGLVTSKPTARTFASTSPMLYHLLPSAQYLKYVDDPVATFDPLTLPDWNVRYGTNFRSQERFHQFLVDSFGRVDSQGDDISHPIRLNDALLTQAENLHTNLDSWTPPAGVEFIQIAGWGVPTTVKGVAYSTAQKCNRYNGKVIQGRINYYCVEYVSTFAATASTTIDGDGTVVVPSALWTSTTTGVSNYWVDLKRYSNDHWASTIGGVNGLMPFGHANILEVGELRNFILDIITSTTKPLTDYGYLSTAAPQSNDRRLRFSLHSPLSLNLYDDQGRHTGISTTTGLIEENIPGTYYDEFADVKYLYTNASSSAHIVMNGYATGTFSFVVDELQGNANVSSSAFKDIPTTPNTEVTLSVESDITTVSPMSVDENGDGHVDFSLVPKVGEVVTLPPLDLIPPEAIITFSTSTNAIVVQGTDETSSTTISSTTTYPTLKKNQKHYNGITTTTVTVMDEAENTTQLVYTEKLQSHERRDIITLSSISYNSATTSIPATLRYKWNTNKKGDFTLFSTYFATSTMVIESHYRPKKDITVIMQKPIEDDDRDTDDDVDTRPIKTTMNGMVVASIRTQEGKLLVKY